VKYLFSNVENHGPHAMNLVQLELLATREIASNFETIFISGAISYEELASMFGRGPRACFVIHLLGFAALNPTSG
jgi:hypothetical protein